MSPGTLMPCYKDSCMQAALLPPEAMNVPLTGAETSRLVAHLRQSGHTLSLDVNPYPPCNHRQERCQGCPFCALSTWGQRAAREAPSHSRLCLPTSCSLCLECLLPPRPHPLSPAFRLYLTWHLLQEASLCCVSLPISAHRPFEVLSVPNSRACRFISLKGHLQSQGTY